MKFEINIPDELVDGFKQVVDKISKAAEEATNAAKEVKDEIKEEVDSFDREAFKAKTNKMYKEIHESLKDLDENLKEGVDYTVVTLDDILKEMFGFNPFEDEQSKESEDTYTVINQLYKRIKEIAPEHAKWFKDSVNSGQFNDRVEEALKETETSECLVRLFDWTDSPQGYFFWKSVYKELGGKHDVN